MIIMMVIVDILFDNDDKIPKNYIVNLENPPD